MDVSIIIVNYRSRPWLDGCVQSIEEAALRCHHEVIVVDNASADGSVEHLRNAFPRVRVIENTENLGFGPAVNRGVRVASGRFILVLNPDIIVHPGAVDALMHHMIEHPSIGLCAPRLENPDGTLQYSCRRFYSWTVLVLRRTPLGRFWPHHAAVRAHLMQDWDHATTRNVDWVLGAAMMVRRSTIVDTRLMDERFFLYFEDVDLCRRVHAQGWDVVYHPRAVMTHAHQRDSAAGWFTKGKWHHLRSWLQFEWKHRIEARLSKAAATAGIAPYAPEGPHA